MFVTRLLHGLLLLLPASVSSLATAPAQAHDVVVRSHPAKNGSVQAGEVTVEIEYSGRIDIGRSRLSLAGPDGGERDLSLDNTVGPNVLKAAAGSLGPGVYTLHWYVLSSDGHLTRGTIPFRATEG
jgi:methionine-rich copper-binding protein CopC